MGYTGTILNAETPINTGSISGGGYLSPEQAEKFIQQTFESNELGKHVRHIMRKSKTGEIDKIGIAKRILRKKTEGTFDGNTTGITTSKLEYATTAARLDWDITEETLRENIEAENLDNIITNMMTAQFGLDAMDLYLNGDTEVDSSNTDHDFLYINDGWIKQLKDGHVLDQSSKSGMSVGIFYDALKLIPNKYNNGKLRWLMSPHRAQEWERYLLEQVISSGGAVPESVYKSPAGIPCIACPSLDNDKIILTDPQNLIVVNTYDMKLRKTTEGKTAIREDKRFYTMHFDFDTIIEELDAACLISGLGE